MANRLSTVKYAFPTLASLTNNTLTNFTQITVSLPETGKTIRKAWVEVMMDDIITVTGGTVSTSTIGLRLGAAAYTTTTNANSKANTGENISWGFTRDFTSHFVTNWTGTSMTCDLQVQINQTTGTTFGMVNVTAILHITYEYDETSATHLNTVLIPLNGPTTSLPTAKTSYDTVPALDTYLPEVSKTYRNIAIVMQANSNTNTNTDHVVNMELSSLGVLSTGNYEAALATDRFTRYVWDITSYITTNTTHTFNIWASVAAITRHHCPQIYMMVTYEYDVASTTSVMNYVKLPMEIDSPMGGTSAADFQRSTREFWVQETNPTLRRLAFFMFWQASANDTGLNARIGTGTFTTYATAGSGFIAGNKQIMIRDDAPTGLTFGRGRNTLQMDVYNTSATQRGGNVGGFWIVNYTSDKHPDGPGVHNRTIEWPLYTESTATAAQQYITTADAPNIPETNYFVNALGYECNFMLGAVQQGVSIKAERLASGEGGLIFEPVYTDISQGDTELGVYDVYATARSLFQRWANDSNPDRLPLETNRRYILNSANAVFWLKHLVLSLTYHAITFTAADSITGFSGTVDIGLHRSDSNTSSPGELILETTRSGDGAFSFTWYDNTEELYVVVDDGTNVGRSEDTLAV